MPRNMQEDFETMVKALYKQNDYSFSGGMCSYRASNCSYRASNGFKCAIGHLIPDDRYNKNMEGCSPEASLVHTALGLKDPDDSSYIDFLLAAQGKLHDDSYIDVFYNRTNNNDFRKNLLERARRFASEYSLDTKFMEYLTE